VRGQRRVRRGFITDSAYWLFTPTVGKLFSGIFVAVVILSLARLLGMPLTVDHLRGLTERDTGVSRQSAGAQLIEFLLLADFLAYWQHRAFHHIERLWRIHAVHHSSTDLDWLSSVRVHPLNEALSNTVIATPLLLLGFSPTTVAVYLPFLTFYAILLHANVAWSYGPLGYVISTPGFHRWHHSVEPESLNKNFAGLFPFFDWIFGTLYLPNDGR
jgi:sterol desaturase/sphingolipid hydroxylase (fatty acid hydroxylase superfamily)